MNAPGVYNLGQVAITTAVTDYVMTISGNGAEAPDAYLDGLDGITAASLQVQFQYGSGGLTALVRVQTRLDTTNWLDIAAFAFTTSTAVKVANLSGLLSKAVTSYAALSTDAVNDGLLGSQFRALLTSTGTYAGNTSVAASMVAR